MSEVENDLIAGLTKAVTHATGESTGVRVQTIHVPDIRAIRERLHMSQAEFAEAIKFRQKS